MTVDPFAARRQHRLHSGIERWFHDKAGRCLQHVQRGHTNAQISNWVGVAHQFVDVARDLAQRQVPHGLGHDETVRRLSTLIAWGGGMTSTEHHVRHVDGGGRIDLMAEIDGQLLLIEYKSGRLTRAAAIDAEKQVLRYRRALGAGVPIVVSEHGGHPCPTVEMSTLTDFAHPLIERALTNLLPRDFGHGFSPAPVADQGPAEDIPAFSAGPAHTEAVA